MLHPSRSRGMPLRRIVVLCLVVVAATLSQTGSAHPSGAGELDPAGAQSRWKSQSSVNETSPGVWRVVSTGTNVASTTNYNSTVTLTANGSISPTAVYNLGDVAPGESITKTWGVTTAKGQDFSGEVLWHGCATPYPC